MPGFVSNSLLPTLALSPLLLLMMMMMMHFSFPYAAPISLVCELMESVVPLGGGMSS
jgi:hypothetical protein